MRSQVTCLVVGVVDGIERRDVGFVVEDRVHPCRYKRVGRDAILEPFGGVAFRVGLWIVVARRTAALETLIKEGCTNPVSLGALVSNRKTSSLLSRVVSHCEK